MLISFIRKALRIKMSLYITYCKKKGLTLGKDVRIMKGTSFGSEPYLVNIGDEVTISFEVAFITHDGATWVFRDRDRSISKLAPISIGKRSFIGARAIILPGVVVGERSIIAAGAVVNKNVPSGEIWGGVPAKKLMELNDYYCKCKGDDFVKRSID
jgi:acetyltransferase-like isoleucine patch superfamily enzyme